jgi:hypothetical protein
MNSLEIEIIGLNREDDYEKINCRQYGQPQIG